MTIVLPENQLRAGLGALRSPTGRLGRGGISLRPLFDTRASPHSSLRSEHLELPTSHRLPLSWLLEAASPPIQYRAYTEVVPQSARDPERLAALREALLAYKIPREILRRQKATGLWGTEVQIGRAHV